jgi:hypothetical protein
MFLTRFTIPLLGILLIAAGISISYLAVTAPLPMTLDSLPDHDYCNEIRKLMAAEKYGEARILAEDVNTPEALTLLRQCDAELKPVHKRLWRAAKAFATGSPGNSIEEAGAALLSDMIMYGDIRDLVLQGYYKVTGRETDPFVAALAGAGLLTEFIDSVDWLPALSKALRRTGAISDNLAKILLEQLKISKKAGKLTPEARSAFGSLKTIFEKGGFIRTRQIIKSAQNCNDIANAGKLMKRSTEATHLIARSAGKNAPEVMEKLVKQNATPAYLKKLALKGPAGITLFLRSAKTVRKGNFQAFIQQLARLWGAKIHLLSLALILAGTAMNSKTIINIYRKIPKHG